LFANAALSAPYEGMNDGFSPRDLEPDPIGVRFVPISKEMIYMVDLAREDWVREIALGSKLDDALFASFQNYARRLSDEHRAGPQPVESGLLPLAKMSSVGALRKKLQGMVEDWIGDPWACTITRHREFTKERAPPAPRGCPYSPPSSNRGNL